MRRASRRRFCAGQAKLIKAGSDIIFQVHYTPNGKPTRDRTKLGLVFAKEPPRERVLTLSATNGTFKIPPGDPNYRVDARFEVGTPVKLSGLHPHMHGRGKDFQYRVVYPTGETAYLLERSALQLALADLVQPGRAYPAAERHEDRMHGALRQLAE